jgi:hypothetical protein
MELREVSEPSNNALEQTVGAKRTLKAPPAAQRERSAYMSLKEMA